MCTERKTGFLDSLIRGVTLGEALKGQRAWKPMLPEDSQDGFCVSKRIESSEDGGLKYFTREIVVETPDCVKVHGIVTEYPPPYLGEAQTRVLETSTVRCQEINLLGITDLRYLADGDCQNKK